MFKKKMEKIEKIDREIAEAIQGELQRQEEEYTILSRTIKNTLLEELRNSIY